MDIKINRADRIKLNDLKEKLKFAHKVHILVESRSRIGKQNF